MEHVNASTFQRQAKILEEMGCQQGPRPQRQTAGQQANQHEAQTSCVVERPRAPLGVMSSAGDKPGLSVKIDWWHTCVDAPRVLSTVLTSYRLQFAMKPLKFNRGVVSIANGDSVHALQDEKNIAVGERRNQSGPT